LLQSQCHFFRVSEISLHLMGKRNCTIRLLDPTYLGVAASCRNARNAAVQISFNHRVHESEGSHRSSIIHSICLPISTNSHTSSPMPHQLSLAITILCDQFGRLGILLTPHPYPICIPENQIKPRSICAGDPLQEQNITLCRDLMLMTMPRLQY
jgi:hypothetical protein